MPRGEHPNSRANLKVSSPKEARENGAKGGRATAEMHRRLKTFRELDEEYTTDSERKQMMDVLKKMAQKGNLKAIELYRDTMGMKPNDKIIVSAVDEDAIDEMKEAMEKRRNEAE